MMGTFWVQNFFHSDRIEFRGDARGHCRVKGVSVGICVSADRRFALAIVQRRIAPVIATSGSIRLRITGTNAGRVAPGALADVPSSIVFLLAVLLGSTQPVRKDS